MVFIFLRKHDDILMWLCFAMRDKHQLISQVLNFFILILFYLCRCGNKIEKENFIQLTFSRERERHDMDGQGKLANHAVD